MQRLHLLQRSMMSPSSIKGEEVWWIVLYVRHSAHVLATLHPTLQTLGSRG